MSFNISADQKILSNEAPLVIPPQLATILGRTETTVLQQIHYWLQRSKNWVDGLCWVYKTYREWAEEIPFLSDRTIRRAIRTLEKHGILKSERMEAHRWNQRKWYTICYDTLEAYVSQRWPKSPNVTGRNLQMEVAETSKSYTKNTSIDLKTTDTSTTHHPVQEKINKEKGIGESPGVSSGDCVPPPMPNTSEEEILDKSQAIENAPIFSEEKKIDPDLEQQIKEAIAPCPFNTQLRKIVIEAGTDMVVNALKVVKHSRKKGKVKNPAGLLRKAIEGGWTSSEATTLSDSFIQWFNLARDAGLLIGSEEQDGKLWVFDSQARRLSYDEMRQKYPMASLQTQKVESPKPSCPKVPVDLSDVLASIDVHFVRLGWVKEQTEAFLKQTYGICRRALLNDDQILDLDLRLRQL